MKARKKQFRSLELSARSLLDTYSAGIYTSVFQSSVGEMDGVREYVSGDKKLNSAASMRTGKIMSRFAIPEKQMNIFIVLDISRSGFYGVHNLKIEVGIVTSLYLSFLASNADDKIGILTFNSQVRNICEPSLEISRLIAILEKDYELSPNDSNENTNLVNALKVVASFELNNSLVLIISDFLFPLNPDLITFLRIISAGKNNSLAAMILINKNEWQMQNEFAFVADFLDSEGSGATNFSGRLSGEPNLVDWKSNLTTQLRQGRCEPIFTEVSEINFLKPLVNYLLKTTPA